MPSARRGSAATPTSNACVSRVWFFFVLLISPLRHRRDPPARRRTGPRSSSSSRSGLGASSPGPSRSTTRAWPSAAWPSGTRRATSRRTFAASSLSLLSQWPGPWSRRSSPLHAVAAMLELFDLCSVARMSLRSRRSSLRESPRLSLGPPPRRRRADRPQAQGERVVGLAGGLRQGRDREGQEEAREAEAAARGRAHAHGRGLQLLRAPREHRAFPASCWFLCLRPTGTVPSPPGVDLSI